MMEDNQFQVRSVGDVGSFLTPIIQKQWQLNQVETSILASMFYLGIFIGSIVSGKLSDVYGRRPMIIIGSILQILTGISFIFVNTYILMILLQVWYGFAYGFSVSITTSTFAQLSPDRFRGKGILLINFCITIGKFYGLMLGFVFLGDFSGGNWRAMMLFGCVPSVVVLVGSILVLPESPRYLIAHKQIDRACSIFDTMIAVNNPQTKDSITSEQKLQIMRYYNTTFKGEEKSEITALFNEYYFKTTVCLSVAWLAINVVCYGQLVVLPYIFGKANKSFISYSLTILGEIPSFIITVYLIDKQNFGRKNSLIYFFVFCSICHFLFVVHPAIVFTSFAGFFMKMCFQMLYPCTTESYGTLNRTMGFGFNSAVGRLGATVVPYIILPLVQVSQGGIFILFVVFAWIGALSSYLLPHETMNRALDYRTENEDMSNAEGVIEDPLLYK